MSTYEPTVRRTVHSDGSADFTVSVADEDYRFSASSEDGTAVVSYQETLSYRGTIRVDEPDEIVYKTLMTSDEMTDFLESKDLGTVRRSDR